MKRFFIVISIMAGSLSFIDHSSLQAAAKRKAVVGQDESSKSEPSKKKGKHMGAEAALPEPAIPRSIVSMASLLQAGDPLAKNAERTRATYCAYYAIYNAFSFVQDLDSDHAFEYIGMREQPLSLVDQFFQFLGARKREVWCYNTFVEKAEEIIKEGCEARRLIDAEFAQEYKKLLLNDLESEEINKLIGIFVRDNKELKSCSDRIVVINSLTMLDQLLEGRISDGKLIASLEAFKQGEGAPQALILNTAHQGEYGSRGGSQHWICLCLNQEGMWVLDSLEGKKFGLIAERKPRLFYEGFLNRLYDLYYKGCSAVIKKLILKGKLGEKFDTIRTLVNRAYRINPAFQEVLLEMIYSVLDYLKKCIREHKPLEVAERDGKIVKLDYKTIEKNYAEWDSLYKLYKDILNSKSENLFGTQSVCIKAVEDLIKTMLGTCPLANAKFFELNELPFKSLSAGFLKQKAHDDLKKLFEDIYKKDASITPALFIDLVCEMEIYPQFIQDLQKKEQGAFSQELIVLLEQLKVPSNF